jgi:hypothetical protein
MGIAAFETNNFKYWSSLLQSKVAEEMEQSVSDTSETKTLPLILDGKFFKIYKNNEL